MNKEFLEWSVITFSRYYVVNLEKCEIVFKLLASNCMLIWLDNALVFGVDKGEDVVVCIDRAITCSKPESDPELQHLVNTQAHRHSHTCRKK